MSTAVQKIRELHALFNEGLLSSDEFAQRKNAILDANFLPTAQGTNSIENQNSTGTDLGYSAGQEVLGQSKSYRLESLLGQGGMGQVWKACDLHTQQEIGHSDTLALKILSPDLSNSAMHRRLLIEEASLVRKLAHDNIVRVYDWARDPATGSYFMIMEYLEGQDLDHYLHAPRSAPMGMSLQQVLRILMPVAHALQYAWEKHRLVHRDLKPSNIFLCKNGAVKLLDFGISAKLRRHTDAHRYTTQALSDLHLTSMAQTPNAGTLGYRAPEAGSHQHQTQPSADVYAVAVMVYQLLEGALPFSDVRQVQQSPSQPRTLNATQWKILQQGFAIDAAQRQADVLTLLQQLQGKVGASAAPSSKQSVNALTDIELRDQQRRERKELEQLRRQQASAALRSLIIKQHLMEQMQTQAKEPSGAMMPISEGQDGAFFTSHTDAPRRLCPLLTPAQIKPHASSWEEAQRYLASMSNANGRTN